MREKRLRLRIEAPRENHGARGQTAALAEKRMTVSRRETPRLGRPKALPLERVGGQATLRRG